jgi:hypothetical protein
MLFENRPKFVTTCFPLASTNCGYSIETLNNQMQDQEAVLVLDNNKIQLLINVLKCKRVEHRQQRTYCVFPSVTDYQLCKTLSTKKKKLMKNSKHLKSLSLYLLFYKSYKPFSSFKNASHR